MNVSLTPVLEAYVRRKVATGLYNNSSEVIREALRLLGEREFTSAAQFAYPNKHEIRTRIAAMADDLRRKGVTSVALFGSAVRGDAGPDSDIDVLIDIEPGVSFSLIDLTSVKALLEDALSRPVDVVTRDGIDPKIRGTVTAEAEKIF